MWHETCDLMNRLQGELLKQGRLEVGYRGAADCIGRTWRHEGLLASWRGNFASVVRYFPQQVPTLCSAVQCSECSAVQ